jgi:hypothetical protein
MNLGADKCIAIVLMFSFKKRERRTPHILIAKVYMFSAGKICATNYMRKHRQGDYQGANSISISRPIIEYIVKYKWYLSQQRQHKKGLIKPCHERIDVCK